MELTSQNIMNLLSFVGNSKQNDLAVWVLDSDNHDNGNRTLRHYRATLKFNRHLYSKLIIKILIVFHESRF